MRKLLHIVFGVIATREGRNPRNGLPMKIAAYRQARFKPGINIKKAVNK